MSRNNSQRTLLFGLGGCLFFLLCLLFISIAALGGLYLYFQNDGNTLAGQSINDLSNQILTPMPAYPTTSALATLENQKSETPPPIIPSATPSLPLQPPSDSEPVQVFPEAIPTDLIESTPTESVADHIEAPPAPVSKYALDPPSAVIQDAIPGRAFTDLTRLYETDPPVRDYYDTYFKLGALQSTGSESIGPRVYERPQFKIGDRQIFRTNNGNIEATLVEITEHAYFWVDDSLILDQSAVQSAGERLETNQFYGQFTHLFGHPWEPGMDGDPHFSIVHIAGSGDDYELGYFSDLDEYPNTLPLFNESNQQEIIFLNMDQLEIGSDLYFGTLVHELQHLSQWNLDQNESVWLNEGISQLAELYIGLDTASPDAYMEKPEIRLDRWAYEDDVIDAHYANTYLFSVYLWEQLTENAIYELVRQPENGLSSVRKVLQGFDPGRSLEQFLADWAIANYLDDPAAGSQYSYTRLAPPPPSLHDSINLDDPEIISEIDQTAVHYIKLDHNGKINLTFAGDTTAKLIESPPASGNQMWFALPENDTHAQLTAAFDLRQLQSATLEFNTWYDLEEGYDYAYVTVSTDQGETWTILQPQYSSSGDYGPAFTGRSLEMAGANNGWLHEQISLNDFIGHEILISFQVLTDFEAVGQGFALDDLAVPELGYFSDVESSYSEWIPSGFIQTGWLLPQNWAVQLVRHGDTLQISALELDDYNQFKGEIEIGPQGGVLIIMPLTPFTSDRARYWLEAAVD